MGRFLKAISAPGARFAVEYAAPTQVVPETSDDEQNKTAEATVNNVNTYTINAKSGLLDRWLDKVVEFSGSQVVFFSILTTLLAWAFLGIRFGNSNKWQVGISDAQAVINMVFDAFLMRQQLNSHDSLIFVSACLRSRISSNKRMLRTLTSRASPPQIASARFHTLPQHQDFAADLPAENLLGRVSTAASNFLGHIATVAAFWACIAIWLGFGATYQWSPTWQLYINSATSALMVLILSFLANIRERHSAYTAACLQHIFAVDAALELRLRRLTADRVPNAAVGIPVPKRGRVQRAIDYYADLVGTLLGIAILGLVMLVWVVLGPVMHFNANWWLLIGTYAGLIGLNDGFVLRNVQNVLARYQAAEFAQLGYEDSEMLAVIGVTQLEEERVADESLSCRVSVKVGDVCSHQVTVIAGAVAIVGLIVGASAMGWSETGQLLCNVPPSIVESFFMMILITGHNVGDQKMRVDLHNVYLRRLKLVSFVDSLGEAEKE